SAAREVSMHRQLVSILLAAGIGLCGCKPATAPQSHKIPYLPFTSPANVIFNIHAAFENQDFHEWDNILAADFVFRYQQGDIQGGQPDSLIRAEAISFAENLFSRGTTTEPAANKITLVIDTLSSGPDIRAGHEGWIRYDVQTQFAATFPEGNTINI